MSYDDNGWFVGPVALGEGFTLLAPEASGVLPIERLRHHAERFFRIQLEVTPDKSYPGGGYPRQDRARVAVAQAGREVAHADFVTVAAEQHPELLRSAALAAKHLGGFDALVARTRRLWQLQADADDVALAAVLPLASLLLGPILTPDRARIYGVKTARLELARLGWRM